MRKLALLILLTGMSAAAQVTGADILVRRLPSYQTRRGFLDRSPATMAYADTLSLSTAVAVFDHTKRLGCSEEGTGGMSVSVGADSYRQLGEGGTVWGDAGFSTGTIRDVVLCNSIDYSLVAPYVLGDVAGGDLRYRRYTFGGGYAHRFGGWTVGFDVDYRAEMAWRDVDPRLKVVVSDLGARAGVAYRLSGRRLFSVDASARSYTQNCDLDFYNPMNDIVTLPLTGMGTYYKRFAGNTNKNSGHEGTAFGASAAWVTTDAMGLQAAASWQTMRMDLLLRNFNNITMAYTRTQTAEATLGYGFAAGSNAAWYPTLKVSYLHRPGTENLFGAAAGASYDKIGSITSYRRDSYTALMEAPGQIRVGKGYATLRPSIALVGVDEKLSSADRSLEYVNMCGVLNAGYTALSGMWLWSVGCGYGHRQSLSKSLELSGAGMADALTANVDGNFRMLTAAADTGILSVSVSRRAGEVVAGVSAAATVTRLHGTGTAHEINISMHILF